MKCNSRSNVDRAISRRVSLVCDLVPCQSCRADEQNEHNLMVDHIDCGSPQTMHYDVLDRESRAHGATNGLP